MPADRNGDSIFDVALAPDDVAFWDDQNAEQQSLVDLINRVLDRGVVITGDVTISVAGVDLVYLGLSAVLTSVATARERMDRNAGPDRGAIAPPRDG
jgi:gas vesicle structural protein